MPVAYQLWMLTLFGIYLVLNIEHLEMYNLSPNEFGTRPTSELSQDDFKTLPKYEVEGIVDEK